VSKAQISRLEALLDRVRVRAAEPRPTQAVVVAVATAAETIVPEPLAPPPVEAVEDLETTQQRPVPSRTGPTRTESEIVMEVEVQDSTQDTVLAVPVEEVAVPEATESRERLVAAEPVIERVPGVPDEPEAAPEIIASVEDVEEAPVSSRRPVAPQPEERLAEMAFGSEEPQPARHTPPPESGRLPAAPAIEFEGDVTGVHEASKPAAPVEIVPEATVADLRPSDAVADMVGQARAPAPTTFVAALDASIAL
jgi:hypothetical protein